MKNVSRLSILAITLSCRFKYSVTFGFNLSLTFSSKSEALSKNSVLRSLIDFSLPSFLKVSIILVTTYYVYCLNNSCSSLEIFEFFFKSACYYSAYIYKHGSLILGGVIFIFYFLILFDIIYGLMQLKTEEDYTKHNRQLKKIVRIRSAKNGITNVRQLK